MNSNNRSLKITKALVFMIYYLIRVQLDKLYAKLQASFADSYNVSNFAAKHWNYPLTIKC